MISTDHDFLILVNNKNEKKIINLKGPKLIKWKKAKFTIEDIFGKPFNTYFSIKPNSSKLEVLENITNEDFSEEDVEEKQEEGNDEIKEEEKDNREIFDNNDAQNLDAEEIVKMKKEGVDAEKIVKVLAENSKTFKMKTTFAQEKYINKKKKKHMFFFSAKKPTLDLLAQAYYTDSPSKINFLRPDSLALFLHLSNLEANSNIVLIEKTKGLVFAGVAQRLNGKGTLNYIFYEQTKRPLDQIAGFHQLNLCKSDHSHIKLIEFDELVKENEKNNKFTHLLIAGELNPKEILVKMFDFLHFGAMITIFSVFMEPLTVCFEYLKTERKCILVRMFDIFTRQYQVLNDRTHPFVNMEGFSGFILTATKTDLNNDLKIDS